jgi:hypothetical protein
LTQPIWIFGANNNASVLWYLKVEPLEISAIERNYRSAKFRCSDKNQLVSKRLICSPILKCGEHIES